MKPEWRPISLTRPTPLGDALASTCAARIAFGGDRERRLKAEALVDEHDVVVDRLGNADHGDLGPALCDLVGNPHRAADRAVAADHEQHVDAHPLQAIDDLCRSCSPREVPRIVPPCSLMPPTAEGQVDARRADAWR